MKKPRTNIGALLQCDREKAVEQIRAIAEKCDDNRKNMAGELGVSPATLWRILDRTKTGEPGGMSLNDWSHSAPWRKKVLDG